MTNANAHDTGNAKHTPGPWQVTDYSDLEIRSHDHKLIASIIQMEAQTYDADRKQQKANARLIAAAPDLLAACKMALTEAEGWAHDQLDGTKQIGAALDALEPIRAAIRKAEGSIRP